MKRFILGLIVGLSLYQGYISYTNWHFDYCLQKYNTYAEQRKCIWNR